MKLRPMRRLWFAGLWLLFPWPLLILVDASVPAVRYLLLAAVAGMVAIAEGGAGPVGLLVLLFAIWGVGTSLLCWLAAWWIAKLMARLPNRAAIALTLGVLGMGLFWAVFFEPYHTPFGRALRGGLLQVLS